MQVKQIKVEKELVFEPITIEIVIDTKEELETLCARFVLNKHNMTKAVDCYSISGYEALKDTSAIYYLLKGIMDKFNNLK